MMDDRAQRSLSIVVGAAVVLIVGWITLDMFERGPRVAKSAHAAVAAELDAATPETPVVIAPEPAPAVPEAGALFAPVDLDAGLPEGAPKTVKLGVVLVRWAGAEGAPANARSKRAAQELATKLASKAAVDFDEAVKDGDPGSSRDIGRVPRGVLDARTEIAVFSLDKGEISGVLETPRGYWIVKRAE